MNKTASSDSLLNLQKEWVNVNEFYLPLYLIVLTTLLLSTL